MNSQVRHCPSCGHNNEAEAGECAHCGTPIVGLVPIELEPQGPQNDGAAQSDPQPAAEEGLPPKRQAGAAKDQTELILRWPWGERCRLEDGLFIGRVPPAPESIARRLELEYPNVSRMHAEIYRNEKGVFVRDLRSLNGTYVNGERLDPYRPRQLSSGAVIRFASRLEASVLGSQAEEAA